jgi:hypothetical protein
MKTKLPLLRDSLLSKLSSKIGKRRASRGSLYIYTYMYIYVPVTYCHPLNRWTDFLEI